MNTPAFYHDSPPPLISPASRVVIFFAVVAVHVLLISLPWLWNMRQPKVAENRFRVKLGAAEPSHDEKTGEPMRVRPGLKSSPSEPPVDIPRPKPKPKPKIKEPSVDIPPRPKPKPKPKIKEPSVTIPPRSKPKLRTKSTTRQVQEPAVDIPTRSTKRTAETKQNSASSDKRTATSQTSRINTRRSGDNTNNTVRIGSENVGQRRGPRDYRTPQGGLTEEVAAYSRRLKLFVEDKWIPPSHTHLGDQRPQATIELEISADGRVLSARIIRKSGVFSMDESIRLLLKALDRVPRPPNGALIVDVNMEVK